MTNSTNPGRSLECSETIHLTGLGLVPAKRARDIAVGDVLLWNYGYRYTVLEVYPRSACFIGVISRDEKTGKEYDQRFRLTRLVGVEPAACQHDGDWDHHYDPDSRLGDYYTCSACGELTQVG